MMNADLVYKERTEKLVKLLQSKEVSCFIFTTSVNMYYYSGFMEEQRPRFTSLIIPSKGIRFSLYRDV